MPRGTDVSDMKRTYRTAVTGEFSDALKIPLTRDPTLPLRYGENPMQTAAVYGFDGSRLPQLVKPEVVKTGKGGISMINILDLYRAMSVLKYFEATSVAVMKHNIPSGFATQYESQRLEDTLLDAWNADARSAFGSVVVFNRPVDIASADILTELNFDGKVKRYTEVVVAPEFEDGVVSLFEKRNDLRLVRYSNLDKLPRFVGDDTTGLIDMKVVPDLGIAIVQKPYLTSIRGENDLVLDPMVNGAAVQRNPTASEMCDLITAWYVNFGVRSNGIVIVKDGVTLAVGSGEQERIGAVEKAIEKAYKKAMDREGIKYLAHDWFPHISELPSKPTMNASLSSDAFYPFRDSIDYMNFFGISATIQPGGSTRDKEVIEAVNEHNMAMPFTLERCFGHF